MREGKGRFWKVTHLDLFWGVIHWFPVWDSSHAHVAISKLLTERSILGLGVSTSMGVVEGHVQEKRPLLLSVGSILFMSLEEFADQKFNAGDVPPHLEDRAVLLRVGKVERIHRPRTHVLLSNNA